MLHTKCIELSPCLPEPGTQINGALHCLGIQLFVFCMENATGDDLIQRNDDFVVEYQLESICIYLCSCTAFLYQLQARKGDHKVLRESIDLLDRCVSSLDMNRFCKWESNCNLELNAGPKLMDSISEFSLSPDSLFLHHSCIAGLYSVALRLFPKVPIAQRSSIASAAFASLIGFRNPTLPLRDFQRTLVCLNVLGADCNRKLEALGGRSCWENYLCELFDKKYFTIGDTYYRHTARQISCSRIFINAGASLSTTLFCRICHTSIKPRYTAISASVRYLLEYLLPRALEQSLRHRLPLIEWREEPVICCLEFVEECDETSRFSPCFYGDLMTVQEHTDFGNVLLDAAAATIGEASGPIHALEEFIDSMMLKYPNRRRIPHSIRRNGRWSKYI